MAGRSTSRALANGASSVRNLRRSPILAPPRPSSSSTAVQATKTIASKPSPSSSQQALEKIGTQLLSFAKDKKSKGSGADTVIVPAGAESTFARRLIFSLLRAGKSVVAGARISFFSFAWVGRGSWNARDTGEWRAEEKKEATSEEREESKPEQEKGQATSVGDGFASPYRDKSSLSTSFSFLTKTKQRSTTSRRRRSTSSS